MTPSIPCPSRLDLNELVARATAAFDKLSPSQKLRHHYMQRRSFACGMGADTTPHDVHCALVEKRMPHEATLTDTQIGLILVGLPAGEAETCASCAVLSLALSVMTNERDEARALSRTC